MNLKLFFTYLLFFLLFPAFYSLSQVNTDNLTIPTNNFTISKFVISLNGGLGYLIGNTQTAKSQMKSAGISESDIDQYFRDFNLGEFGEASVHYMVSPTLGFGIDYNIFTTRGQVKGYLDPGDGWIKYYGIFSDKVYTNFVGASYLMREKISAKWGYYNKLSLGMAFYRDEASIINTPILVTGKSFAAYGELGLTYSLSKYVSINTGLSYFISKLGKIKSNDGTNITETKLDKNSKENLSRLNLSTGLIFHF